MFNISKKLKELEIERLRCLKKHKVLDIQKAVIGHTIGLCDRADRAVLSNIREAKVFHFLIEKYSERTNRVKNTVHLFDRFETTFSETIHCSTPTHIIHTPCAPCAPCALCASRN